MTRNILSFIAALAAATTIAAAQTPPPSSAQPPAQPGTQTPTTGGTQGVESNDLKSDRTVVLTGCVAAWQGNAAGVTSSEPSSSTSTAGAKQFMLSNAQPSSAAASASSSAMGSGYLLKGGSDVDLSQHLNHKVEVTGTLDTAGRASGTYPTTQPAGQTSGPTMQTFHVTSVKMISTSCQ